MRSSQKSLSGFVTLAMIQCPAETQLITYTMKKHMMSLALGISGDIKEISSTEGRKRPSPAVKIKGVDMGLNCPHTVCPLKGPFIRVR